MLRSVDPVRFAAAAGRFRAFFDEIHLNLGNTT